MNNIMFLCFQNAIEQIKYKFLHSDNKKNDLDYVY